MLIDPELIDQEWHDYIVKLIHYRLHRAADERIEEVYARVMKRLRRMARRQIDAKLVHGEGSMKALLAQAVRWSVVDWLRYINGKKRRLEDPKRSSTAVESIGQEDPGIEAIIWPGAGVTVWAVGGIMIREVFGQNLEKIPHRALLRAQLWGKSYAEILRDFAPITRNQLRGRLYRARRKANKLWQRALVRREATWEQERREDRKNLKVGGFRGGRHHGRHKF
jgi:hypothetical protein